MLGLIDLTFIIVIVISVLFALYRGLIRELLGIAAWILSGFVALYSYAPLQPLMNKMIDNPKTAGIVGALLAALVALVIMTLINAWITKRLRQSALSGLDRTLGLMFGVVRACLLAAVCYLGCAMFMPEKKLNDMEEKNFSVPYIRTMAGWIECLIPDNIKTDIKAYEQGKLKSQPVPKIGIELKKSLKEELARYQDSDRHSLDDMIDQIAEE